MSLINVNDDIEENVANWITSFIVEVYEQKWLFLECKLLHVEVKYLQTDKAVLMVYNQWCLQLNFFVC